MMLLRNTLLAVLLAAASALAESPSDDTVAVVAAYQDTMDAAIVALQDYKGGISGLPSLSHALYSTRTTAKQMYAHMQSREAYSAADSALIRNRSVEAASSMVHALNIGQTKLPLAQQAGCEAIAREAIRQFHEHDTALMQGIMQRLAAEDRRAVQEGFQPVLDAYDATLRAS